MSSYAWADGYVHDQDAFERERESVLAAGWVTPYPPLVDGQMRCCYLQRGFVEWFCHPTLALHLVEHGMIVNGARSEFVRLVGRWPGINALQVQAKFPDAADAGFVDASRAGVAA